MAQDCGGCIGKRLAFIIHIDGSFNRDSAILSLRFVDAGQLFQPDDAAAAIL